MLAGPAGAALNDYGTRAATRLLATDAVIHLVQAATRVAHAEFLRIVDDKPGAGQNVYLQLRPVVLRLAGRLGLEDQVAAKLPPDGGQFVVLDNTNVTIQTVRQSVGRAGHRLATHTSWRSTPAAVSPASTRSIGRGSGR